MSVTSGPVAGASPGGGWTAPELRHLRRLRRWVPLLVLAGLCLLIGSQNQRFFGIANLVRIAAAAAIPLVLAAGETFIILLGSIDLSVEGAMAVGAVSLSLLVRNDSTAMDWGLLALPPILAIGALVGALTGALHVAFRIPSFMVSLGTWFGGVGLATIMLGGGTVRVLDPAVRGLALDRWGGLPILVWIAFAAWVLAWVVQSYTRVGRYIYAIGGGEDLAALSGIAVNRIKVIAFALAGACYALGGVLVAAQLGQGNAVIGQGRLFTTITAVVVGGSSLAGGEGGVVNTLVGVLVVGVLANGMVLLGISPYWQQTVQGLLIVLAVALSIDRARAAIVK
jgi:ribose transport system permease protein